MQVPECLQNCVDEGEACDPNAEAAGASAASTACPAWCTNEDTDGMCRGVPACQPCPVCDEILEAMAQEQAGASYGGTTSGGTGGAGSTYSYSGSDGATGAQAGTPGCAAWCNANTCGEGDCVSCEACTSPTASHCPAW